MRILHRLTDTVDIMLCSEEAPTQVTQTYSNYYLKDSQDTETEQRTKRNHVKCIIILINAKENTLSTGDAEY